MSVKSQSWKVRCLKMMYGDVFWLLAFFGTTRLPARDNKRVWGIVALCWTDLMPSLRQITSSGHVLVQITDTKADCSTLQSHSHITQILDKGLWWRSFRSFYLKSSNLKCFKLIWANLMTDLIFIPNNFDLWPGYARTGHFWSKGL